MIEIEAASTCVLLGRRGPARPSLEARIRAPGKGWNVAKEIVTVCLPSVPIEEWEEALKAAMAPFDMNQPEPAGGEEPQGEWDWYHVYGGDGDTGLPVLAGHEDDPRIIHHPVFSNGRPRARRTARCDGGARGLLDFDTDRSARAAEATAKWDGWSRFASPYPPARPLDDFHRRFQDDPLGYPFEKARQDYLSQPLAQAVLHAPEGAGFLPRVGDAIACFGTDRDGFVQQEVCRAIPTNVLLTLDGTWIDGTLDPVHHPGLPRGDAYFRYADAYLRSLDNDAFVIRVRFHS
ncbi:hypothetical protein [Streptomyces sp. ISL-11]|uniref:hypothetical protein n=1 Tax=Streptomyces sp. ISL-11 TaxID=2819174 RepID=UPI001BE94D93|nr:hypothetical protein [Streptomyces sp. ISL-11]MBT2384312.1 hypothetical protein [Streptomyces sp. ISL-11]